MEELLEKYRKEYIKQKPTQFLVKNGWDDLRVKIAQVEQEERAEAVITKKPSYLSGLIFASLLLLVLVPTISFAQKAEEGDFLYPVKVLSDQVVSKVTNTPPKVSPKIETKQEVKDPIKETIKEATNGAKKIQEDIQKKVEKEVKGIQTRLNQGNNSSNKSNSGNSQKPTQKKENPSVEKKQENSSSNQSNHPNNNQQNSNQGNQGNQGQGSNKNK